MSKVSLAIDTETKTVILKVDGKEVPNVESFNMIFFDQYCDQCGSYDCPHDLEDSLSVNFSVEEEVDNKSTKTRINYCLDNSEQSDATYTGFKVEKPSANKNIQDPISKLFK